jgi:hypothetical protein
MVYYANPVRAGLDAVASLGDGYSINIGWFQAYPSIITNQIAYHIYYSTIKNNVFTEGVKYVSIDTSLEANIIDLTPGQEYFFSVRPVEYDPTIFNLAVLPIANNNLRFYPSSILRQNISATDTIIPLLDITDFPSTGIVKIGVELIQYLAVDPVNVTLVVLGNTAGSGASFIKQINGFYYLPYPNNVGGGSIANLTFTGLTPPTETWTLKCIFVENDGYTGPVAPIPSTAAFVAEGSISGCPVDKYGNVITWKANGPIVSNGIISFSIIETSPVFKLGDSFTIQVQGVQAGTTGGRGYANTPATLHTVSGFDGYTTWSPTVSLFTIAESNIWDRIFVCQNRFEYPNFPFTIIDGYKQVIQDYLSTNLAAADAANATFPMYDYAGYHRTDPVLLLNGTCVGSYIGGQMGCIDGNGNYNIYRGFSLQDQNTQREEIKLTMDGQPACLIQRVKTGNVCSCYLASSEYPDDRCPFCYGTKFVFGYQQYFNPRYSDGRILVRLSPTDENLKMTEAGLESDFPLNLWTLTVPSIYTRDIIVLFDQDGNEEFRYEVGAVTRNKTILGLQGGQLLKTFRVRKTDPAYQIRIFRDTADFPNTLNTTLGFTAGIPPHSHTVVVNEKVLAVNQINQTTGISQGHNHPIVAGQIMPVLGHTHQIILP